MKITFFGAAQEVTGSCYLVETANTKILVDCGMFQGSKFADDRNIEKFLFNPADVQAVVITHTHIDHVGRLPKLVRDGFFGPIYATPPTVELIPWILEDAYKVMKDNQKRSGHELAYEEADYKKVTGLLHPIEYGMSFDIEDLKIIFHDAGHILGSAFVEVEGDNKKIVFSGDVGNKNAPIVRDTENIIKNADAVIMESTYGDRIHEDHDTRETLLVDAIKQTIGRGGTLLIPAFAIERTQDLLYLLNNLSAQGRIPKVPIFLDSPLAIHATQAYRNGVKYYDEEAKQIYQEGDHDLFDFPGLTKTPTPDESKKINNVIGPKIIIAGAGMMNGGRILHHLMRYLSDPHSTVMIIGYQAQGTLGRLLYEGAHEVKIFKEKIHVKAEVKAIGAFSAHADQTKLLQWVSDGAPKKVILVHGESEAQHALSRKLERDYHTATLIPARGATIEL